MSDHEDLVLVTGGSGYLGGWTIVALLQQGYRVRSTLRSLSREGMVRSDVSRQVDPAGCLSFVQADLLQDHGWHAAADGCNYVLHVASPMGQGEPKGTDLVTPAREGTLRVLRAAADSGVRRVVLTSSTVTAQASTPGALERTDETLWTDPDSDDLPEYGRSKTLAERAAWDFMAKHTGPMTLTTILPGMILGPILTDTVSGSVEVVSRMLTGKVPATPRIGFSISDVRDLTELHYRAMVTPGAGGQRFLGVGDFLWLSDIARILHEHLGSQAAKVPTRNLPAFVLRLAALFQEEARFMAPMLNRQTAFSAEKAARLLDWHPRPAAEAVLDCARSLIRRSLV